MFDFEIGGILPLELVDCVPDEPPGLPPPTKLPMISKAPPRGEAPSPPANKFIATVARVMAVCMKLVPSPPSCLKFRIWDYLCIFSNNGSVRFQRIFYQYGCNCRIEKLTPGKMQCHVV